MSGKQRVGDLEIQQDLEFQQREWRMQRIGWVIIALLLLATVLGLLGSGFLSQATAGASGDPLWLEFERFAHLQAPTTVKAHVGANAGAEDEVRLWLNRPYLERVEIQSISPEPDSVEATAGRLIYVFKVAEPNQPIEVDFYLQPTDFGRLEGQIGLDEGPSLNFNHLVYP